MTPYRLPRGPVQIAIGSGVMAASQLAVVAIAGRTTTVEQLGQYLTWFMAASLAGLLFTVLESLVPQSLLSQPNDRSRRLALARWSRGTAMALVPVGLVIILGDALAPRVLDGSRPLLAGMLVYASLSAGQSLVRGQATAEQDFGTFLSLMSIDGITRVTAAAFVGFTSPSATGFAMATCAGATAGLLAGWTRTRSAWGLKRCDEAVTSVRALGQTSWSTASSAVLNNGLVPWMASLGTVSAAAITSFSTAQTLSRAPMMAIAALYAPLIAPLARLASASEWAHYLSLLRRAMVAALLAGIAFTLVLTFAGNALINIFLGVNVSTTPRFVLALLGVSTIGLLVTAPAQAALTSRGRWSALAWSWAGATLVLALTLRLPADPTFVAALAAAASATVVAVLSGRAAISTQESDPNRPRSSRK